MTDKNQANCASAAYRCYPAGGYEFGSLFSGIGGMDLGLERAGWKCAWQVENDEYATKVLAKHWPAVHRYGDVRECGRHNLARVDLIAGGFPCQDISNAGPRLGIEGERSGLWREFARIIGELRPRYVLVENAEALAIRGLDTVLADLALLRFDAEWAVIPACAFGASHTRERLFVVAYAQSGRPGQLRRLERPEGCQEARHVSWPEGEPGVPRMVDGLPGRVDRLRGIGNAVVPQVAEWIGSQILRHARDAG